MEKNWKKMEKNLERMEEKFSEKNAGKKNSGKKIEKNGKKLDKKFGKIILGKNFEKNWKFFFRNKRRKSEGYTYLGFPVRGNLTLK